MKLKLVLISVAVGMSSAMSGCTSQQTYYSAQAWQRNECDRLVDQSERERCLSKSSMTYEDYKRQTEGGKK